MKHALKSTLIGLAACLSLPHAQAESAERIEIKFTYDRTLSPAHTYRNAEWTARKACGLNGRVAPMKRALEKSCVKPAIAQFVAQTGNRALIAFHARRTGQTKPAVTFAKT
ncbi:MAG: hypothetical protein AAFR51_15885 [Pseudomonadota bacterium]